MAVDLLGDADRDGGGLDDLPDPRAHPPNVLGVPRADVGQPLQQGDEFLVARHNRRIGVRGDAETLGHPHSTDSGELPQIGTLAAGQRELRLVDLLKAQHVFSHRRLRSPSWDLTAAQSPSRAEQRKQPAPCTGSSSSSGTDSKLPQLSIYTES